MIVNDLLCRTGVSILERNRRINNATTAAACTGRANLARENEAGGSWGQEVHILHVKGELKHSCNIPYT